MSIPFDLWGQSSWPGFEVLGEQYHKRAILAALGLQSVEDDVEEDVTARLVPEPSNPHDRNAVRVEVGGHLVGYIPRAQAARYQPLLIALVSRGFQPQVAGRIRCRPRWEYGTDRRGEITRLLTGDFWADVYLCLGEPHLLMSQNAEPTSAHRVLPRGNAVQAQREEQHMDVLRTWVRSEGEAWVFVTLHIVTEHLARSSRTVVELRINDQRVGQLTPKMSGEFVPAIQLLEDAGYVTAARAIVKGNALKADVVLYAARSGDLPSDWASEFLPDSAHAVLVAQPSVQVPSAAPQTGYLGAPPPAAPAAWYQDPIGENALRWWDGTSWTEHTHNGIV